MATLKVVYFVENNCLKMKYQHLKIVINRMIGMAWIEAIRDDSLDEGLLLYKLLGITPKITENDSEVLKNIKTSIASNLQADTIHTASENV